MPQDPVQNAKNHHQYLEKRDRQFQEEHHQALQTLSRDAAPGYEQIFSPETYYRFIFELTNSRTLAATICLASFVGFAATVESNSDSSSVSKSSRTLSKHTTSSASSSKNAGQASTMLFGLFKKMSFRKKYTNIAE